MDIRGSYSSLGLSRMVLPYLRFLVPRLRYLDPAQFTESRLYRRLVQLAAGGFLLLTVAFYGALFSWLWSRVFHFQVSKPSAVWLTLALLFVTGLLVVLIATFALRLALAEAEPHVHGTSSFWLSGLVRLYLQVFVPRLKYVDPERLQGNKLYRGLVQLAGFGFGLFTLGFYGALFFALRRNQFSGDKWDLVSASWWFLTAGGVSILLMAIFALRLALSPFESQSGAVPDLERIDYRQLETIRLKREREQEDLFRQNLRATFVLQSCVLQGVRFFDDLQYQFQRRINILLGKNGFGKTVLLRTIAALIQNDVQVSGHLFDSESTGSLKQGADGPSVKLEVTRDGKTQHTVRDPLYFQESVGKIPLLAIPDSRFVNRAQATVGASATGHESLSAIGASHFLSQEPYEDVVQELLAQLGIEYLEGSSHITGRKFSQPIFRLIESVVRDLTGDDEFSFSEINRAGRTGFQILVKTTGSQGAPLPIQSASQGTLSIVAIFGLIYSFLRSLDPGVRETEVMSRPGIVIIDEIDAHLHPAWQQKIVRMLRERFPNVQFIITAHSPVIVAGCEWREVSVLRRDKKTSRFYIETLERDFVGAASRELYDLVFEIEELDQTYLEYATKSTLRDETDIEQEIASFERKGHLSPNEENRKDQLERELRLVERAKEVREERLKSAQSRANATNLEDEIRRLRQALEDRAEGKP